MKPYPVAVQLYSVREAAQEDFPGTLSRIADMGYAGVEPAGLHGFEAAEVRRMLDDLGMKACSTHGDVPSAENLGEIVTTAQALGYDMHISGPGFWNEVKDRDEVLRWAEKLQQGAELLKAEGLRYSLHNHEYEFDRALDGRTPHELLVENAPDACFEIDTYWVAVGGKDPAETIRNLGPRAPFLHIKDGPMNKDEAMLAVGDGKMDWAPIMDVADAGSTEWLVVELDRCDTDMFEAVDRSLKHLVGQGYGKGRD